MGCVNHARADPGNGRGRDDRARYGVTMFAALMTLFLAATAPLPADADQTKKIATIAELERALATAVPGDTILIAPGNYRGFSAKELHGAKGKPIALRGTDPDRPPSFGGPIHLSEVTNLSLEHLLITGSSSNGLNIDDGGTFETPSGELVLRHITVRDCGGSGNHDGIKLSGIKGALIDACTVERWGRNGSAIDMVGCSDIRIDACTFRDDEHNPASNGVQMKGGSRNIQLMRSRFEHAGHRAVNLGGSTGMEFFRPRPEGFEAKDVFVEGCTFVGSNAPIAFVGCDGARVRFNTFFRPRKWFMRILQETRDPQFVPCRNGLFSDNLVVYRLSEVATPINIGPGTAPETFAFERNYWFAMDSPTRSIPTLPRPETAAAGNIDPLLKDPERGDFGLREQSPARGHGADAFQDRPNESRSK